MEFFVRKFRTRADYKILKFNYKYIRFVELKKGVFDVIPGGVVFLEDLLFWRICFSACYTNRNL